ncbi:Ig-like domain-containing protein [Clostridium grantii]|uniref:LPXTG-motif cell wall anchor domain-containing protein n=1 Tax=Clostridium grantii DSM 8605 TaxID=1121316 RepID=A0A1M5UJH7_9CLOT|nr:Ig-like domain-containing protein [Clostridium grantii]SHH63071.1 LPXTG-motif cell wall anchor domain-containing protein [Clostridium grantii DSM 8605]
MAFKKKTVKKSVSAFLAFSMISMCTTLPIKAVEQNTFPTNISFEDNEDSLNYTYGGGSSDVTVIENDTMNGDKALQVVYKKADWPGMYLRPKNIDNDDTTIEYWDLGDDGCLSFDIMNPMDITQEICVKFDDETLSGGNSNSVVYKISVPANKKSSFYVSTGGELPELGMHTLPPSDAGTPASFGWGKKDINLNHITQITFWINSNKTEKTLLFDNIKVVPNLASDLTYMNNVIDQYGQYTKETWPGKVTSDQELIDSVDKENAILDAQIQAINDAGNLSKYGGLKDESMRQEATGRFYVKKVEGKWTFVDPDGYPYIATGLDIVRLADMLTWITGRDDVDTYGVNMFENLPSKTSSLGDHYTTVSNTVRPPYGLTSGDAFNFYSANLERKYGDDYLSDWTDMTLKRFKAWGFSSLGCWAEPSLYFGKGEENKMPYVANGWINGTHKKLDNPARGGKLSDPFDPQFAISAANMATSVQAYGVDSDKWCLGIYVDNEIEWGNGLSDSQIYSVIDGVFAMDANLSDSYAKKAFIEILKSKYVTIDELNSAWGTTLTSFDDLNAPYTGKISDKSLLLSSLADKYYSTVSKAVKEKLPNVLYLGSRLAQWGTSAEVAQACAKYADVVSFNCYKTDVNQTWMNLGTYDKPIIIGEFHFNATDSGMFAPGLVPVKTQADRGAAYKDYMTSVFESEYFVGAHWFQYYDQPILGRAWDGENTNAGFVDVADQPFTELVDAAKEINEQSYSIKFGYNPLQEISLNETSIELNKTNNTASLVVNATPIDASNSSVIWTSSNSKVATVDTTGKVIAIGDGYATIQAKSVSNQFAIATCSVKVTGFADITVPSTFSKISFEDGETNNINPLGGNGKAVVTEFIKDSTLDAAVTNGDKATKVTIAKKSGSDGEVSTLELTPDSSWSFGKGNKLKLDVTNPNDFGIQTRVNIMDNNNRLRTYYFNIAANTTRTLTIENFDKSADSWGSDGYYGANDGLDTENIKLIALYLWEADGNIPADTEVSYIVDNIFVKETKSYDFDKISFETGENITAACTGNGKAIASIIDTDGVTHGTNASKITVSEKSGKDGVNSTYDIVPSDTWNFGNDNILHIDVKNPNNFPIQFRTNIKDDNGVLRTYYFPVLAGEKRTLSINNFGASGDNWGSDGFFGGSVGLDTEKIDLLSLYVWEASADIPAATEFSFIVDNIYIEEVSQIVATATTVILDKLTTDLTKTNKEVILNAVVYPDSAVDTSVVWATSNPQIATVDQTGKVTAVGNGTAYISATATDNSLAKAFCKINVTGMEVVIPPTTDTTTTTPTNTPTDTTTTTPTDTTTTTPTDTTTTTPTDTTTTTPTDTTTTTPTDTTTTTPTDTTTTTPTDTTTTTPTTTTDTNTPAVVIAESIDIKNNSKVSKSYFESILGKDKTIKFIGNAITWSFNGLDLNKDFISSMTDIDLSMEIPSDELKGKINDKVKSMIGKNVPVYAFSLSYDGQLPGKASITIFVGTEWANKSIDVARYFSDKNTYKIVDTTQVDKNGYMTFTTDHCSDYFITETSVAKLPKTGSSIDTSILVLLGTLMTLSGLVLFISNKKKKEMA